MPEKSILIIGAGIGGLSTGCYARMNGYRATILEMHTAPGGLCTSWKRHGYTFDGSIHNLGGTSLDSAFHQMWRELGVVPALRMHAYEELVRVERPDGAPLIVYTDLDRLEQHMKELAPADAAVIDELIGAARRFTRFDLLGLALATPLERAKALTMIPMLVKYGRVTLEEFAQRFTDPFLRRVFPTLIYDWPNCPVAMLLTFLGRTHVGDYGWPAGGSIALARAVERRFLELGGEIRYEARVQSIIVENDRAVGVRLSDGTEQRADIVVSNANGHATIFDMLGGRYTSAAIRSYYDAPENRIEMGIHVSLGLARAMPAEPHAIVLPLAEPVMIADEMRHRLYVEPFAFDPSLAPPRQVGREGSDGDQLRPLAGAVPHARALQRGEASHRRERDPPARQALSRTAAADRGGRCRHADYDLARHRQRPRLPLADVQHGTGALHGTPLEPDPAGASDLLHGRTVGRRSRSADGGRYGTQRRARHLPQRSPRVQDGARAGSQTPPGCCGP